MIRLVTGDEMRRADRRATQVFGVSSLLLMENAGRGAADALERVFGPARGRRVAVVCGKGNNGGDGFVVARQLAARGAVVDVWIVGQAGDITGDAGLNLAVLRAGGLPMTEVTDRDAVAALRSAFQCADLVVDGLLGTGMHGPATGLVAEAIEAINDSGRPVCALDLPSGLSADRAEQLGPTVRAQLTVTFGLPKVGLFLGAGLRHAGRIEVADLGVPRTWLEMGLTVGLLEAHDARAVLPAREVDAHKGWHGRLLVVAGSLGKTGAAALACRGALRSGTGLVTCAVPVSQQPVVAAQLAEVMTEPLPETAAKTVSRKAIERVLELAERMDALAVGPGAGLDTETQAVLLELIEVVERPMVVDADALTAAAGQLNRVRRARGPRLLTPHSGEAARLLGCAVTDIEADRLESARRLAAESGAWVALKGARTIVASPNGERTLNPTGNPGLATGGTGDVLTGIAGGLLAQGLAPEAALRAAVYLHGLAGDLAAGARGETGLIAGDVADAVPMAIRRLGSRPEAGGASEGSER